MSGDDLIDDEFLHDYDYVEESYEVADELAEHAIASPPPLEGNDERGDYDPFDYWEDIEYYSDGYTDVRAETASKPSVGRSGQKRKKSGKEISNGSSSKRRKIFSAESHQPERPVRALSPIIWHAKIIEQSKLLPSTKGLSEQPFALLKDWKERFKDYNGPLPVHDATVTTGTDHEVDHDSLNDEELETTGGIHRPGSLDPETDLTESELTLDALKESLRKALANSGDAPQGLDEATLLQYAMRLLADEDDSEGIAGQLAEDILSRTEDDEDALQISNWVNQMAGCAASSLGAEAFSSPNHTQSKAFETEKAFEVEESLPKSSAKHQAASQSRKVEESPLGNTSYTSVDQIRRERNKRKAEVDLEDVSSTVGRPKRPARSVNATVPPSKV